MRDDAILALVGAARRHDDHLALGLRRLPGLSIRASVIGEEGAELVRPPGEHETRSARNPISPAPRACASEISSGASAISGTEKRLIGRWLTSPRLFGPSTPARAPAAAGVSISA